MAAEHRQALPRGTKLNAYTIEKILGAGGFGITYKAHEAVTDRAVAIKEYLPASLAVREHGGGVRPISDSHASDFDWGLDRFRSEARLLVGLRHPSIVPTLAYFEAHDTGYLVMEFQEGTSLGDLLRPDKAIGEAQLRALLAPLLDGVAEIHESGILHRDIKPDNIFVRSDGTPLLLDFGAARQALGQHSRSLTAIISEGYAPYEQYTRDGNQGPWTDVYAIAATALRCLSGRRPPDVQVRVGAKVRGMPDPIEADLGAVAPSVSAPLVGALRSALAVNELDRPQTIGAFRASLGGAAPPARPTASAGVDGAPIVPSAVREQAAGGPPRSASDSGEGDAVKLSYEEAVDAALRDASPMPEADRRVWNVYREYDVTVREAVAAVEGLGERAIDALGKVFLSHRQAVVAARIAERIRMRLSDPRGAVLGGAAAAVYDELRAVSETAAVEFAEVLAVLGTKADIGEIRARILDKHDAMRNHLRSGDLDALNAALKPFRVRMKLERGGPAPVFLVSGERVPTSTHRQYLTLEEAASFLRGLGLAP